MFGDPITNPDGPAGIRSDRSAMSIDGITDTDARNESFAAIGGPYPLINGST